MRNTVSARIDLNAIRHNLQLAQQQAATSRTVAMLKADAYGHGLLAVAEALQHQADMLAVARFDEAWQLRQQGIVAPLLLLGTLLNSEELHYCSEQNIAVAVHSLEQANQLARLTLQQPLQLWLKFDSGMHRLGLLAHEVAACIERLQHNPQLQITTVMTHMASADQPAAACNRQQLQQFMQTAAHLPYARSIANSASIISLPESHADWIRPGIMLYGGNPLLESCRLPLQAAMTLTSTVLAVRRLNKGETVGYGQTWTASAPCRIATIGIGYGDGYPRHASNDTPVLINGQRFPLAGRVSMDLITVALTEDAVVNPGDEAVLWGPQLPADDLAHRCGTISYALFTGVTQRVPRIYSQD